MAIDIEANNDMEMQLQSDFFGELPREIRDMIYLQFWAAGEKDTRNEDFEKVWRMSSTWHEHWRCEEIMLDAQAQGQEKGTLFLSNLLTCKRIQRCTRAANSNVILRHNKWSELCTSLSNSYRFAALRNLVLRLDLEGDDRFWWEVRETWALSALHRSLRPYITLYLPDLTVDVREKRSFQYASPGEKEATHLASMTDDPFLMYSLPPHITNPPVHGDSERMDLDFKGLVRYGRRRWTGEGTGDGVQPRLEFFTPRDQGVLVPNSEASGHNMPGLFWAMLMS
ncbi:hypothetical protein SCUP234_07504 [Seiridium cupressi]